MKRLVTVLAAVLASAPALIGSVELLVGIEGPAREPEFNKTQEWFGLQYTTDEPVLMGFQYYAKALVGSNSSDEFLIATGLAYAWTPLDSAPEFQIRLQAGPSYTEVGWPHTGTDFNWTTDLTLEYHGFLFGYSHSSNGGLGEPNSGLDMILLGYSIRWD